jgi:hypothetical protein
MRTPPTTHILIVLVLALGADACGGDDNGDDDQPTIDAMATADAPLADAAPPDAVPADAAVEGTLTIEGAGITGATGKIALVFVTASGGGPILAGICEPITADPGSFSAVAKVPGMGNPCNLGAEVVLPNGDYDLNAGLYTPGMMTPEQCATSTVTVAGDTVAQLPAFGACN